ncbi:hypothetical protein K1X84_09240 [bacterium]|nr:hypothetical protein [bacterium]
MKHLLKYLLTAAVVVFFLSCEDDQPLDEAWNLFENEHYSEAYDAFTNLVTDEGSAAIEGQGWSAFMMDSIELADSHFESIEGDSLTDSYAGWAFVGWTKNNYAASVDRAQFVLQKKPTYVFLHDKRITDKDIKVHQAYSQFHLGNYAVCNELITQFDASWVSTNDPNALLTKLEQLYNDFK